jgi:hypothetical protein
VLLAVAITETVLGPGVRDVDFAAIRGHRYSKRVTADGNGAGHLVGRRIDHRDIVGALVRDVDFAAVQARGYARVIFQARARGQKSGLSQISPH